MGRYLYAVFAVSLVLHLVLFWPGPQRLARPVAKAFVVRLVDAPTVKDNFSALASNPEVDGVLTGEGALGGAAPIEVRPTPVRGVPGERQVAMVERRVGVAAKASVQAPSPFAADTLDVPVRSKVLAADTDEAAWVGRYRLALALAAVRLQHASEKGAASGLQGQSVIVVHFKPGGARPEISVSESSGKSSLDEGALDLIRRAVMRVPAPVQDRPFSVLLPVLFEAM